MKWLAVLFALVPAVGSALLALLLLFLVTFPFENPEPMTGSEMAEFALLFVGAVAALLLALVVVYAIVVDNPRLALHALLIHLAIALGCLAWGLSESEHSDGTVLAYALGVEVFGVLSVTLGAPRET